MKIPCQKHRLICLLPTLQGTMQTLSEINLAPLPEFAQTILQTSLLVCCLCCRRQCRPVLVHVAGLLHPCNFYLRYCATLCALHDPAGGQLGIVSSPLLKCTSTLICLLHVLQVTMQTLADSELGVSRYPIFSYDSRGGGGMAKGADRGQHMRRLHCMSQT